MRSFWVAIVILGSLTPAQAVYPIVAQTCLSPREMRDIATAERVVAPALAIGAARRAVPGADMLRATLCPDGESFIYIVSVLRKDGRVVHVVIDGRSGKVAATQ